MRLLVIATLAAFASGAYAEQFNVKDGWSEIAPSVYQRVNADGTIERAAFGEQGAAFEHDRIRHRIEELKWDRALWSANTQEVDQTIRDLQSLIDMGKQTVNPPQVKASQSGTVCTGQLAYDFTNTLSVTSTNATLFGKTRVQIYDDWGPPAPPTDALAGVHTTIYRYQQAPVDKVAAWNMNNPNATWEGYFLTIAWTGTSSSATPQVRPYPFCTSAEVFHQVSLDGGICGAGDFHSWSKTYPGCYP